MLNPRSTLRWQTAWWRCLVAGRNYIRQHAKCGGGRMSSCSRLYPRPINTEEIRGKTSSDRCRYGNYVVGRVGPTFFVYVYVTRITGSCVAVDETTNLFCTAIWKQVYWEWSGSHPMFEIRIMIYWLPASFWTLSPLRFYAVKRTDEAEKYKSDAGSAQ